ncbi:MAG: hypothetical protein K2X01_04305 [Cyanobacteria bacterium]|nr:hypothetical protein [Cyanobacteriota bacterium]
MTMTLLPSTTRSLFQNVSPLFSGGKAVAAPAGDPDDSGEWPIPLAPKSIDPGMTPSKSGKPASGSAKTPITASLLTVGAEAIELVGSGDTPVVKRPPLARPADQMFHPQVETRLALLLRTYQKMINKALSLPEDNRDWALIQAKTDPQDMLRVAKTVYQFANKGLTDRLQESIEKEALKQPKDTQAKWAHAQYERTIKEYASRLGFVPEEGNEFAFHELEDFVNESADKAFGWALVKAYKLDPKKQADPITLTNFHTFMVREFGKVGYKILYAMLVPPTPKGQKPQVDSFTEIIMTSAISQLKEQGDKGTSTRLPD